MATSGNGNHTRLHIVPDIEALIIWLFVTATSGMAAGELLKGGFRSGIGNIGAGALGGAAGAQILSLLIPALSGSDVGPIVGQATASAAILIGAAAQFAFTTEPPTVPADATELYVVIGGHGGAYCSWSAMVTVV